MSDANRTHGPITSAIATAGLALVLSAALGRRPPPGPKPDYVSDPTGGASARDRDPAAGEAGRGREAAQPQEIPARGWWDIMWRVYGEIEDDRILAVAAGVTFYGLLALFPALAAFVSLYGLVADPATISEHLTALGGFFPAGALDVIGEQVKRITTGNDTALGFAFFSGLAVSLWSANAGVKAVFDALNVAYEEKEKRSFIVLNLVSLAFTLGSIVFIVLAMTGIVVVPVIVVSLNVIPVVRIVVNVVPIVQVVSIVRAVIDRVVPVIVADVVLSVVSIAVVSVVRIIAVVAIFRTVTVVPAAVIGVVLSPSIVSGVVVGPFVPIVRIVGDVAVPDVPILAVGVVRVVLALGRRGLVALLVGACRAHARLAAGRQRHPDDGDHCQHPDRPDLPHLLVPSLKVTHL